MYNTAQDNLLLSNGIKIIYFHFDKAMLVKALCPNSVQLICPILVLDLNTFNLKKPWIKHQIKDATPCFTLVVAHYIGRTEEACVRKHHCLCNRF